MNIDPLIKAAIAEDVGEGDHTTLATVPDEKMGRAKLLVKENGVISGTLIAKRVFEIINPSLLVQIEKNDGVEIHKGEVVFTVSGSARSILIGERLALNFMQRMSGIATKTRSYVNALSGLNTKVLDTRKTTPGLRLVEKLAVEHGGGMNHRFGLYDMIMIKDNHVDFAGGISNAINGVNKYLALKELNVPIEIEVRGFKELKEVIDTGSVSRIMLDNFSVDDTRKAVDIIAGKYEIESSGGITLETIRSYAECGVDFVSVGDLTHTVDSLDLSLKAF